LFYKKSIHNFNNISFYILLVKYHKGLNSHSGGLRTGLDSIQGKGWRAFRNKTLNFVDEIQCHQANIELANDKEQKVNV